MKRKHSSRRETRESPQESRWARLPLRQIGIVAGVLILVGAVLFLKTRQSPSASAGPAEPPPAMSSDIEESAPPIADTPEATSTPALNLLPEAQLDRFLMQAVVTYPTREEELEILALDSRQQTEPDPEPAKPLSQEQLFEMRRNVAELYLDPKLHSYIVDLVQATRHPKLYDADLARWCRFGASPRASIALARCARARAWLDGDEFVAPHHIQLVAPEILRHRLLLTFEAEAEGITTDEFVNRLLNLVAIP